MKKKLLILLTSVISVGVYTAVYAQETLQTVTTRGNVTTTSITSNSGSITPATTGNATGNLNLFAGTGGPSLSIGVVNTGNSTTHWGWLQTAYSNSAQTFGFLALNPLGGNVGIGTTTPSAKLTLAGNNAVNPNTGAEVDYAGENITFRNESGVNNFNLGTIKMVQPNGYYLDHADMVFLTALGGGTNSEKMRISGTGNVGIGTTDTKGYKFAVNGSAIVTSMTVKLNANWPDYVFKTDFKLLPLNDVKTYIDVNHHLPDVPTEQDIKQNGLDLGEMNKVLVKKVEELTLYLIRQNERIEKLETELKNNHR